MMTVDEDRGNGAMVLEMMVGYDDKCCWEWTVMVVMVVVVGDDRGICNNVNNGNDDSI